jgi:hypothetical protein
VWPAVCNFSADTWVIYRFFGEKSVKTNRGWGDLYFVSKTAVFWNVLVNQKEMEF